MATAGSIVIDLLMRTGAFETDSKRAEKRLKELQKVAADAGKVLGTAIVAGATAAVTALKLTIDSMDEMSKAAQKVGASTEEFSKLTYAAGLADVSMETLASSLGKLTKSQAAALNVTSQQAKVFDALGISIKDADGNLRDSTEVLVDFADRFKQLKGSPEAMAAGFALFGRSFQELIPLLKDGGDGIRAAGDELEAFGGVLSTEAGNNAEEFNDNLTRLETSAKSLGLAVASDLLPDLVELSDQWVGMAKDGETLSETASEIADTIRAAGDVVKFVYGYFDAFGDVLGGATMGLIGFAEAAKGVINLDWDQVKRGIMVAQQGADLAYYGEDEAAKRNPGAYSNAAPATQRRGTRGRAVTIRPVDDQASVDAYTRQLQAALGRGSGAAAKKPKGSGGGSGKSDAQRDADQLDQSYQRLKDSLNETYELFGKNTEAAQVLFDTQNGELSKLSQARKDELVQLAQRNDAQKVANELSEAADDRLKEETKAFEQHSQAVKDQISDMQFELSILGLSNIEREKAIALRYANVDAMSAEGQEIGGLIEKMDQAAKANQLWAEVQNELSDAMFDAISGTKSLKDSFLDLVDNIEAAILRSITDNWAEQIGGWFKTMGGSGQGQAAGATSGGGFDWGALIGAFFGGAKAGGGDTIANRAYLVGEHGPEMFVPRTAGTVMTAGETAGMGGGAKNRPVQVTQQFYNSVFSNKKSESQRLQESGMRLRVATRNS